MSGWVAGWLSVTLRYCINTDLFDRLTAPSFYFLETPADTQFQGNPFSGDVKYTGVGKLAIFMRFSTDIAVYLGNGARDADGYYGTLIGSRGCRIQWYNFRRP